MATTIRLGLLGMEQTVQLGELRLIGTESLHDTQIEVELKLLYDRTNCGCDQLLANCHTGTCRCIIHDREVAQVGDVAHLLIPNVPIVQANPVEIGDHKYALV